MQEKKPTKKNKRSSAKRPNLNPNLNSRIIREYADFDYLKTLDEASLDFLESFVGEYYKGSVALDDNRELDPTKNIHKDPKFKKELYDSNNQRNRDQYGLTKAKVANTKLLNYDTNLNMIEEELGRDNNPRSMETAYVDFIEHKQIEDFLKEYDSAMLLFNEVHE